MEGHRRSADEPDPNWYPGKPPEPSVYESGVHERPSGAFRLPDQRAGEHLRYPPTAAADPLGQPPAPAFQGVEHYQAPNPYAATDPLATTGTYSRTFSDPTPPRPASGGLGAPGGPGSAGGSGAVGAGLASSGALGPGAALGSPDQAAPRSYGSAEPTPAAGSVFDGTADPWAAKAGIPVRPAPRPGLDGVLPSQPAEYPAVRAGGAEAPAATAGGGYSERSTELRATAPGVPPVNGPGSVVAAVRDARYRSRYPVGALVLAAVSALLMVPVVRLLFDATFVDDPAAREIVPAVLLTLGLSLTGFGLYTLAAGARPAGRDAWLRPPVGYLPVGLILLLGAALAAA